MRLPLNAWLAVLPLASLADCAYTPASTKGTDDLAAKGVENVAISQRRQGLGWGDCTLKNAAVRKEWYARVQPLLT